MFLYVNGDSNSAGAEIFNPKDAWPSILANKLNYKLINQAWSGASNDRILRTTKEFLNTNPTDCFILIGWTSWEREEWEFEGAYYDINASGTQIVPKGLEEKYKHWVAQQNSTTWQRKSEEYHKSIYTLHQELNNRKIPHLFFNALMSFQHPEQYVWNDCYLEPYNSDLSYFWYLKKQYIPNSNYHYLEDAQEEWANVLYNYIQEKQL